MTSEEATARALGFLVDYDVGGRPPMTYEIHRGRRIEAIEGQPQTRAGYAIKPNKAFRPVFDDEVLTGRIFSYAFHTGEGATKRLPDSRLEFLRYHQKKQSEAKKQAAQLAEMERAMSRMEISASQPEARAQSLSTKYPEHYRKWKNLDSVQKSRYITFKSYLQAKGVI